MLAMSLLALGNCARGNATISHWQWLVISAFIIYTNSFDLWHTALWMWIVVVITIFPTKPLLWASDGHLTGQAFVRQLPIIPALLFLQSCWGDVFLLMPLWYWAFGKLKIHNSVRIAEGFTGMIIGVLL